MKSKNYKYSWIATVAVLASAIWFASILLGEILGNWGSNLVCYKYLGCTNGFFGYDAIEHFFFGLALVLVIIWFCKKFSLYSILNDKRWKTVFILIASAAFISLMWELFECAHDAFRISILHETLFNFRLHINSLDQPTNIDTMGDFAFSLLGSIIALFFGWESL